MSHHWKGLKIIADAANRNNRRITADNDRHVCKVYGYTPEQAQAKAELMLAALNREALTHAELLFIANQLGVTRPKSDMTGSGVLDLRNKVLRMMADASNS